MGRTGQIPNFDAFLSLQSPQLTILGTMQCTRVYIMYICTWDTQYIALSVFYLLFMMLSSSCSLLSDIEVRRAPRKLANSIRMVSPSSSRLVSTMFTLLMAAAEREIKIG